MATAGIFAALKDWWQKRRVAKRAAKLRKAVLDQTLEALISMTGLSIRAVSGYEQKLRPAMSTALDHINDLVAAIPGPLDISPQAWNRSPQVNALFISQTEMAPLFTRMGEAKKYFAMQRPDENFALLTMDRQDKTVFAVEKQGSLLKRDVPRTSVTYTNHRLLALAPNQDETRDLIKMRALGVLAQVLLEEIKQAKAREDELAYLENLYKVKLDSMGDWVDDAIPGSEELRHKPRGAAQMEQALAKVREDLRRARRARNSNQAHMEALQGIMESAPKMFKARQHTIYLNEFAMVAKPGSDEQSNPLTLARISLGEDQRREALLVRFRQGDFA